MHCDINKAVKVIKEGKILIYPTESIFGLGCDPFNEQACQKINSLKQRSNKAGLICLINNIKHLNTLAAPLRTTDYEQIRKSKTKHISWILPAKSGLPKWLIGPNNTICVRLSNDSSINELCSALDQAIISTSANEQGMPAANTIEQAKKIFKNQVDYYLDLPLGDKQKASKILTITGKIIRN